MLRPVVATEKDSATNEASVDECLAEAPDPFAAYECELADPAGTLFRYLQLRAALSGSPLPDATVEALIVRVEEATGPVPFDEEKIWGEWQLCWQRNTKAATSSQKALAPLPQALAHPRTLTPLPHTSPCIQVHHGTASPRARPHSHSLNHTSRRSSRTS